MDRWRTQIYPTKAESFIRFTPRKPKSIWSAVNIKKIEELTEQGLMYPAGLAVYAKRTEAKSKIYSYEQVPATLAADLETQFKANAPAWAFIQAQPPYYQKKVIHWVMRAKQEATRVSRLEMLMKACAEGKRV